jgi:hypothetical protein
LDSIRGESTKAKLPFLDDTAIDRWHITFDKDTGTSDGFESRMVKNSNSLFLNNLTQNLNTPLPIVSPLSDSRYSTPKGTSSCPRVGAIEWKTLLAYITGMVVQELLLRNQITVRVWLIDGKRTTLAALGKRLGKQALAKVMSVVNPETLLA